MGGRGGGRAGQASAPVISGSDVRRRPLELSGVTLQMWANLFTPIFILDAEEHVRSSLRSTAETPVGASCPSHPPHPTPTPGRTEHPRLPPALPRVGPGPGSLPASLTWRRPHPWTSVLLLVLASGAQPPLPSEMSADVRVRCEPLRSFLQEQTREGRPAPGHSGGRRGRAGAPGSRGR